MSLDIGSALTDGISRTVKRNGLVLIALAAVIGIVATMANQTLTAEFFADFQSQLENQPGGSPFPVGANPFDQATPLALPIPAVIAAPLVLLTWVAGEALYVVSDRTFVSDATEGLHDPRRNLPLAVINGMIGTLVVGILIAVAFLVGLIGLLIGGPILATFVGILFIFYRQEIAVEDKNFVDALSDSVSLTKGHRIELFALALIMAILSIAVSFGIGLPFGLIPGQAGAIVGALVSIVVTAVLVVVNSAVFAQAYRQLSEERAGGDGDEEADDGPGPMTADDLESDPFGDRTTSTTDDTDDTDADDDPFADPQR